ncbi:MAG TPA: acyl-CoA dehydrogenase family protein [Thermodesulfobacteriota bacterium]|nr:acyl-CoA dehydrogenase family protein [Thermodesulfobacteriota bacterium]
MDFELSHEQKDVQRAATEFARGEFDPDLVLELDENETFPDSLWKKAAQLGFIGIHYPEEFGGQGLGLFESLLVIEAFCRVDSGVGSALSTVDLGSEVLLKFGSLEQKERFLTPLARGERRLGVAFAESEDGRDLTVLSAMAEKRMDEYSLQGEKRFVLNAPLVNTFLTLCKEPKEGWITLIVELQRDGIEIHPIKKMGLKMIPFGDLSFKGTCVPLASRIGEEGQGLIHVHHHHHVMALRSAAQGLGTAQGAFDRALQHAKQREQFGRKLSQFQVIRHKLADMAVRIEGARWLTYKSATEFDRGRVQPGSLWMAQLEASRGLISVVDQALQIFGGYGYTAEQAIEHYFRDAWAIGADLGTEEEQKDAIADILLGPDSTRK